MKTTFVSAANSVCLTIAAFSASAQSPAGTPGNVKTRHFRTFSSPERAADALVTAATNDDVDYLEQLFGPSFREVGLSSEGERGVNRWRRWWRKPANTWS